MEVRFPPPAFVGPIGQSSLVSFAAAESPRSKRRMPTHAVPEVHWAAPPLRATVAPMRPDPTYKDIWGTSHRGRIRCSRARATWWLTPCGSGLTMRGATTRRRCWRGLRIHRRTASRSNWRHCTGGWERASWRRCARQCCGGRGRWRDGGSSWTWRQKTWRRRSDWTSRAIWRRTMRRDSGRGRTSIVPRDGRKVSRRASS